jgi:maleylpyruvate isomerase
LLLLYNYWRSSASFRVRIALNYKQVEFDSIDIDLSQWQQHEPAYVKISPSQLVPALQIEDDNEVGSKNSTIFQSIAILEYLEEQYPTPEIIPTKLHIDRAYIRGIAMSICCEIHPLNNLRVLNYITNDFNHSEQDKLQWYHHWLKTGFDGLETIIKDSKHYTGKFCYKDKFSIADICLIPQIYNAKRFNFDLSKYPILSNIYHEGLQLDVVKQAFPTPK